MRALTTRAARRAATLRPWRLALATAVVAIAGPVALAIGARSAQTASPPATMHMTGMADTASASVEGTGYWRSVSGAAVPAGGKVRTYFISADKVVWDYAPRGRNEITGKPFDEVADTYVKSGPGRIGSRYLKCLYRGYTDASFQHRVRRAPSQKYLGLLGPVIRAEVGDTIRVVYRNTCPFPTSIHPHGVFYGKSGEGAPYADGTAGAAKRDDLVRPGGRHTYVWKVPERAGPGPNDGSSVMWMYHSHADEVADTYAGLMGPMEITRRGMARADGSPKDVDREFFVLFSVMNENDSPFIVKSLDRFARKPFPHDLGDEEFGESNLMHSINGYVFGNQPMMRMRKGKRVRWYVMSMGTEVDLHTPHWHGNTVTVNGMRMDVVSLLPATMVVADMVPDDVGTWLFHCHVNDHIRAGMLTRYQVVS
jgi:hephaestin